MSKECNCLALEIFLSTGKEIYLTKLSDDRIFEIIKDIKTPGKWVCIDNTIYNKDNIISVDLIDSCVCDKK